jgi:hypothetical protein
MLARNRETPLRVECELGHAPKDGSRGTCRSRSSLRHCVAPADRVIVSTYLRKAGDFPDRAQIPTSTHFLPLAATIEQQNCAVNLFRFSNSDLSRAVCQISSFDNKQLLRADNKCEIASFGLMLPSYERSAFLAVDPSHAMSFPTIGSFPCRARCQPVSTRRSISKPRGGARFDAGLLCHRDAEATLGTSFFTTPCRIVARSVRARLAMR